MTDARYPDRWLTDRRLRRLSDADHRSFVMSLVWSVSNRTDGHIEPGDLALIPDFAQGAVNGLVSAGLWLTSSSGWVIADYRETQTSKAQLDGLAERRANDRERQARKRSKDGNTDHDPAQSRDMSRDVQRDQSSVTHRTGKDRTGTKGEGFKGGPESDQWVEDSSSVAEPVPDFGPDDDYGYSVDDDGVVSGDPWSPPADPVPPAVADFDPAEFRNRWGQGAA